jgi:hypothetical protein
VGAPGDAPEPLLDRPVVPGGDAETVVNGLMAIPNLIALIALSGVVVAETESYLARKGELDEDSDSTIVAE